MGKQINLWLSAFFIFVILSTGLISAQPFAEQTSNNLQIQFSKFSVLTQNEDHTFFFHTINETEVLTNETLGCDFDLYHNGLLNLYNTNDIDFTPPNEWSVKVLGGNFSELGEYSYIISCNSSSQAGFTSVGFDVTHSGLRLGEGQGTLYIILFSILIFFFVMNIFLIRELPRFNERDEEGKILSVSYLKYLRPVGWMLEWALFMAIMFIAGNLAFAYMTEQLFANFLITIFWISLAVTPIIITVWIIWIYSRLVDDRQIDEMIKRGIFPQRV